MQKAGIKLKTLTDEARDKIASGIKTINPAQAGIESAIRSYFYNNDPSGAISLLGEVVTSGEDVVDKENKNIARNLIRSVPMHNLAATKAMQKEEESIQNNQQIFETKQSLEKIVGPDGQNVGQIKEDLIGRIREEESKEEKERNFQLIDNYKKEVERIDQAAGFLNKINNQVEAHSSTNQAYLAGGEGSLFLLQNSLELNWVVIMALELLVGLLMQE